MKKVLLILCTLVIWAVAINAVAQIRGTDILGAYGNVYNIVWDGWKGELVLRTGAAESYLEKDGNRYEVRYQILQDPQDTVEGMKGPGATATSSILKHRIIFWVDFNNTPDNNADDQRFDGYFFTKTKDAMAGVTWWNNIPFGFYATFKVGIPG